MRKKLILLLITILLVGIIPTFSGCYVTESGTMEDLAGTYKLTKSSYDNQDQIALYEISEYLVVGTSGRGYRYYKDNRMEEYTCQEIGIKYIEDEENKGLFNHIEYTLFYANEDDYDFGDKYSLGYNKSSNILITATPQINGDIINVKEKNLTYDKISNKTTLETVEKELSLKLKVVPYEYVLLSSPMIMMTHYTEVDTGICLNTEYKYYVASFDFLNNKASVYYMLRDSEEPVAIENLPLTFTTEGGVIMSITFDNKTYNTKYFGRIERVIELNGKNYTEEFYAQHGSYIKDVVEGLK